MSKNKEIPFEEALVQLANIIEKLELEDVELEQALQAFEQGIKLTRQAQKQLDQAQKRVLKLTGGDDDLSIEPLEEGSE